MYCKNCREELNDEEVICPVCGWTTENCLVMGCKRNNWAAIAGFSCEILTIFLFVLGVNFELGGITLFLCLPVGCVGFVLGIVGWVQAIRLQRGKIGFAIAATIISTFWLLLILFMLIGLLV